LDGVNAKGFYLLLYLKSLRTVLLSPLEVLAEDVLRLYNSSSSEVRREERSL